MSTTRSTNKRRMGVDNTLFGAKSWSYDGAWGVRTQSYASLPDSSRWYIQEPWGTVLAEAPVSGVVSDLRYYVRDHLGSTRSVRRENTTKFCWFEYDPYGTTYASGGWTGFVQDRFTGHEFDIETNMYWAPYRYYRPDMLRWASRDPLGMIDGPNVYGYTKGRPVTMLDKNGAFGLAGFVGGAIAGCLTNGIFDLFIQWAQGDANPWAKAACSCAGGAITGGIGGMLGGVGLGMGGVLNAAGSFAGGMATCMCQSAVEKGASKAMDDLNCCLATSLASAALGGITGAAIGGTTVGITRRGPVSSGVSREGSAWGDAFTSALAEHNGATWGGLAASALPCCK